jgi:hypothetical protein
MDEVELALHHARIGTDLALSIGGMECACGGAQVAGLAEMHAAQWSTAQGEFVRAIEYGTGTKMEVLLHQTRGSLAAARIRSGEIRALRDLEIERATAERLGDGFGQAILTHEIAEAALRAEEPARAEAAARAALAFFEERGLRPSWARSLETLAVALDAQGDEEAAVAARRRAEELWREIASLSEPGTRGRVSGAARR